MINLVLGGPRMRRCSSSIIANFRYWNSHIGMQHQKELDRSRACIKLMMSAQIPEISIDFLKMSHQYGVTQANKIYLYLLKDDYRFADVINSIVSGDFVQLEINDGFERFKAIITRVLAVQNSQLHTLGLHEGKTVQNFLTIAEHLQKITPTKFNRVILAILCNYITHFEEISDSNLYKITNHLTARSYASPNILKHFQNIKFDKAATQKVFNQGTIEQICVCFETLSDMLQSLINLQKNGHQLKSNPKLKQQLIQTLFSFLENRENQQIIFTLNPKSLFLDQIFEAHKARYFNIIDNILNPLRYPAIKMKQNLFQVIFDKLLLFTESQDKLVVQKLLEKYSKCLKILVHHDNEAKISGGALIMLCEKFSYYSKDLFEQILNYHIKHNFKLKPMNFPFSLKKNVLNFQYQLAMRIYEIGVLIKLTTGKNIELEDTLIQIFTQKLDRLLTKKSNENCNLELLFFSNKYEQFKNLKPPKEQYRFGSLFAKYQQYFLTQQTLAPFLQPAQKIQKALQVTFNEEILKDYSFPVIMKLNTGARLKILIWITFFSKRFSKTSIFFNFFNRFIEKNQALGKLIEQNIAYPGLIQGIVLLNFIAKESVPKNLSVPPSAGQKFIDSYIDTVNKILQKQEYLLKKVKESEKLDIKFSNNIQFLSEPLHIRPWIYRNNPNLQIKIFFKTEIAAYLKKNEKLITKLSQQLKLAKSKNNLQNIYAFSPFAQFPYSAGFSVLKDKKKYFIMFVEPTEKESYQLLLKIIKEKKQTKGVEGQRKLQPVNIRELSLSYYSQRHAITLISNDQDIKKFIVFLSR